MKKMRNNYAMLTIIRSVLLANPPQVLLFRAREDPLFNQTPVS